MNRLKLNQDKTELLLISPTEKEPIRARGFA